MEKTLSKKTKTACSIIAIAVFLILVYLGDSFIAPTSKWSMLMTVLEKGAIYALVAVSMNLLNGFTGLFSLGQAGFMLIGAYAYAIFSIPAADHEAVYQYFEGGALQFSIPEILMNALGGEGSFGGFLGQYLGMFLLIIFAGLLTAGIAFLIGIPVLRLKSDYLAIATLGGGQQGGDRRRCSSLQEAIAGFAFILNLSLIAKDRAFFSFDIQQGRRYSRGLDEHMSDILY